METQHIILLLDNHAPSFCFYENQVKDTGLMPLSCLRKGIQFAQEHALGLHVIYGKDPLPRTHQELLETVPHIRIRPYQAGSPYTENDIVVMDSLVLLDPIYIDTPITHLIIRIPLANTPSLYTFIENNAYSFKRLSIIYQGIEQANEDDLNHLRLSFDQLRPLLHKILTRTKQAEINIATDRMLLTQMNNCDAGQTHLTLAPDGNFYICPGFYHAGQPAVGNCDEGIRIGNAQLYRYDHAPICKRCDCFQCKRCVYLNRLITGEVNTPSHAQCVISHHERNLSGILLQKLQKRNLFTRLKPIPPLFYTDPIDTFDK